MIQSIYKENFTMEERIQLTTHFTEEEIKDIYQHLIELSIRNYEKNEQLYEEVFKSKYDCAKDLKTKEISKTTEEIKEFLLEKQVKYQKDFEENKEIIRLLAPITLLILKKHFNENRTPLQKLNYIFDFVTSFITYSEDYYWYVTKTPPKNGIEFDFKNRVPVNTEIEGLLVQGQGLCDEIANLLQYLGSIFNIPIKKTFGTYKEDLHALNYIKLGDKISYIDATRLIRKDKKKEECFLVSEEKLNEHHEYTFENPLPSLTIENKEQPTYSIKEIIEEINSRMPTIKYIEEDVKTI